MYTRLFFRVCYVALHNFIIVSTRYWRHQSPGYVPFRNGHHTLLFGGPNAGKSSGINGMKEIYHMSIDKVIKMLNGLDLLNTDDLLYKLEDSVLRIKENEKKEESKQNDYSSKYGINLMADDPIVTRRKLQKILDERLDAKIDATKNSDFIIIKEREKTVCFNMFTSI